MFKLTHNALVFLATATLMPLSLAAGVSELKEKFQSGEQSATQFTAAKVEPGKLGQRFAHLIPVRKTTDTPEELAAKLTKRKAEEQKAATTPASPEQAASEAEKPNNSNDKTESAQDSFDVPRKEMLTRRKFDLPTRPKRNHKVTSAPKLAETEVPAASE